jgi:hypothetical protein
LRGSTLNTSPENLLAAIDLINVPCVAVAIQGAEMSGSPHFIPMHRGAGAS